MKRLADSQSSSLPVVTFARRLVQGLEQKDRRGEVTAVFSFVRDRVRYVRDPVNNEFIQAPLVTLELRSGDCDDKAVLLAALLNALGYQTRFKAVGPVVGILSHVFVEVLLNGSWIPLDSTEPQAEGWAPSGVVDAELSSVSGGLSGLGIGSISKAVKSIGSGVKKAASGKGFASLVSIKKTVTAPVKVASAPVKQGVSAIGSKGSRLASKTLGSPYASKLIVGGTSLVPVVGPYVAAAEASALQYSQVKQAQKEADALSRQFAEEAARAEAAAEASAAALSAPPNSGFSASSPLVLVAGAVALGALLAFFLKRGR